MCTHEQVCLHTSHACENGVLVWPFSHQDFHNFPGVKPFPASHFKEAPLQLPPIAG